MPKATPLAVIAFSAVLWTGCAGRPQAAATPLAPEAQAPIAAQPSPAVSPALAEPDEPTEDACLACHADKQRLIDTAKPVEVEPSESSGVG